MLQPDSLVTDLMFTANASIDAAAQMALVEALGGQTAVETKQLIDVDRMLDPRQEMELSPSMPFRRRGERRVMIVDDAGEAGPAPRADPTVEPILSRDFRPAKEALIAICTALPVRLGRLFVLGTWGDAVLVARSARDLRGICLLPYALDPQVDVDGKRRQTPLSQKEFEGKLLAYEKRLDEMDEQQILERLSGVNFERRGDLLIVDVLEADGTWDQRKSMALEAQLGAMDKLSLIPGAPQPKQAAKPAAGAAVAGAAKTAAPAPPKPEPKPEPKGPPLGAKMLDDKVILVFPAERFDLEVAAALGKRDWDQVIRRSDPLTGEMRDRMHRDGAAWIAPLEFLSEVFIDGKPLSKAQFEKDATVHDGIRSLEVHFPRYGDATLLDVPGKGRFVTSLTTRAERAAALVSG
jgi:hypothetical protein